MPIVKAVKGTNIESFATFSNPDGTPFAPTTAVRWAVRDFSSNVVATGVAVQDLSNPAKWTCNFVLPLTVPSTHDNVYSLVWWAANSTQSISAAEYFAVVDRLQPPPYESAQVVVLGSNFNAELCLPEMASTLSLRICTYENKVLYTKTGTESFQAQATDYGWRYSIPINATNTSSSPYLKEQLNLSPQTSGINSLFLYWNWTDADGNPQTVITRLYIANGTMVRLMDDMRCFLDRIRNEATIPQLQLTDVDLARFAIMGMDRFNGTQPVNNGTWSLGNLPEPFYQNVFCAACIRFLQSQYFATGMTAFEFNGQAVSLSSNQTEYIQGMLSNMQEEYNSSAETNKKAIIRSSYFGSVGGNYGPTALLVGSVPYGFSTSYLPVLPFMG